MKLSFGKILIGVAVFGICLGAAFAAGTVYGRHSTTSNASAASIGSFTRANGTNGGTTAGNTGGTNSGTNANTNSTGAQASASQSATPQAGGRAAGGAGFAGGFGGRPIEAKVASIASGQLQVTLASGASTTVALNDQTTYASSQKADKSALKSGAEVYVTTTAATDGTLTAQSVVVLPASPQSASSQPSGGSNGGGTRGGTGGTGGGFGGGAAANRPVTGTVASVNGQQLQITLANGSTTSVTLSDQTTYATTQKADQSAVTTGSSVLVTISRASDGTISAQSVVVLPASGQTS